MSGSHGAEALRNLGVDESAASGAEADFLGPGVRGRYAPLSFLHGTLVVSVRVLNHGGEDELYRQLRNGLERVVKKCAAGADHRDGIGTDRPVGVGPAPWPPSPRSWRDGPGEDLRGLGVTVCPAALFSLAHAR